MKTEQIPSIVAKCSLVHDPASLRFILRGPTATLGCLLLLCGCGQNSTETVMESAPLAEFQERIRERATLASGRPDGHSWMTTLRLRRIFRALNRAEHLSLPII